MHLGIGLAAHLTDRRLREEAGHTQHHQTVMV